jgi:hypothetical protein
MSMGCRIRQAVPSRNRRNPDMTSLMLTATHHIEQLIFCPRALSHITTKRGRAYGMSHVSSATMPAWCQLIPASLIC